MLPGAAAMWLVCYLSVMGIEYLSPLSMAVVIPVSLALNVLGLQGPIAVILGTVVVPIAFLAWSTHLWRGEVAIPKRSRNLAMLIFVASVLWFMWSGQVAVQTKGLFYVILMQGFNVLIASILVLLYRLNRAEPKFGMTYAYHWLMFAWIGWCAFPWMGPIQ
jgi:hypothetical protein